MGSFIRPVQAGQAYCIDLGIDTRDKLNRKVDQNQDEIERLVRENLVTNEPCLRKIRYEFEPINKNTLKEKIALIFLHAKQNKELYQEAATQLFFLTTTCLVSFVAAKLIGWYLPKLYADISAGKFVYQETGLPVGVDYYYVQATFLWGLHIFFSSALGIPLGKDFFYSIKKLISSLYDFYKNSCRLKCYLDPHPAKSLAASSSNQESADQKSFIDPISMDEIPKDWIQAPRFIKLGSYTFTLDSFLTQIFAKPLVEGYVAHPIENRLLTDQEQDALFTDLSDLFMLDKERIVKFWDPYFCDFRKLNLSPSQKEHIDALKEPKEKTEALEEILLQQDLPLLIRNWNQLAVNKQAFIKKQISGDFFASKRRVNFLREFDSSILDIEIKNNETESFTLKSLLEKEKGRTFSYVIPSNI